MSDAMCQVGREEWGIINMVGMQMVLVNQIKLVLVHLGRKLVGQKKFKSIYMSLFSVNTRTSNWHTLIGQITTLSGCIFISMVLFF